MASAHRLSGSRLAYQKLNGLLQRSVVGRSYRLAGCMVVCSVVVVGFADRTVVSSVDVEVVEVRGSSDAQPESAPRTEARRQGSKSFFIILILGTNAS